MTRQSQGVALARAIRQGKAKSHKRKMNLEEARKIAYAREVREAAENLQRIKLESKIAREALGRAA